MYYTSSPSSFSFREFVDREIHDLDNYSLSDIEAWKSKYSIDMDDEVIWVSPIKWVANRYNLPASEWDSANEILEKDMSISEVNGGFIIPETNDGDHGYLFIFKNCYVFHLIEKV